MIDRFTKNLRLSDRYVPVYNYLDECALAGTRHVYPGETKEEVNCLDDWSKSLTVKNMVKEYASTMKENIVQSDSSSEE